MAASRFDVIIVGAGLAGSALAARLADLPLRVALLEAGPIRDGWPPLEESVDDYDARVSALTPASQRLLEKVDAWSDIANRRACGYRDMHVWDADGTGNIHFNHQEIGSDALGHIVENRLVNAALLNAVRYAGVSCFAESPVAGLLEDDQGYALQLEDGRELRAKLLVAADGGMSRLREWADFETREWNYGHKAIACTVQTEQPHQATAWQRFMPEGPLAFLPLSDAEDHQRYCSIVWSAVPERADHLMSLDDDRFCEALGVAFEFRLGAVARTGKRFCFPLRQRHAVDYYKPGLVLIGDAAHSIHPLAGQGINLGFLDVEALAQELERAVARGLSVGDEEVLRRYQRRRKGDNLTMMAAMDGFKTLFGRDELPLRWLRNTGMKLLDGAGPIKREIIRQAMGG